MKKKFLKPGIRKQLSSSCVVPHFCGIRHFLCAALRLCGFVAKKDEERFAVQVSDTTKDEK
jgi:hypothetical protein